MLREIKTACLGGLFIAAAPFALAAPAHAMGNPTANVLPVNCGRACLTDALTAVLNALVSKDISKLPLGNDVQSTQNGVDLPLYDGIWQVTSALGKYRLDVIDPESGEAGTYATLVYGGKMTLIALRIATWEQKIHEIEFVISTGASGPMANAGEVMDKMATPRPQFLRTLPQNEQMSRADLVRVADSYFANLQGSTGKTVAPFAPTCNRLENGFQTTNGKGGQLASGVNIIALGCEAQQRLGFFPFVTSIRDRRFPIVDRERGIVMAFGYFDHSGTVQDITLTNGEKVPHPLAKPTTFVMSESFQIEKDQGGVGRIDQVEAVLETVPYKMRNAIWVQGDHAINPIGIPTGK